MNCTEFQESLFEWLEGRLDAARVDRMRSHAEECARCRELEELATGDAGLPAVEPPDEMLASIMARTTGGACDRALQLVCERLDEDKKVADAAESYAADVDPLLQMHLDECDECASVARALARLRVDLPAMAEMEPDAGFVPSVMAATVGDRITVAVGDPSSVAGDTGRPAFDWRAWTRSLPMVARISEFLEILGQRPRIAYEGAFVGTLAFMLIIGVPSAGVAELPSRLMAEVRQERLEVQSAVNESWSRAAEAGREIWASSTSRLEDRLGEYVDFRSDTARGRSRIIDFVESWRTAGREIAAHIWEGEFGAAFARMWRLWTETWSGAGNAEASPDGGASNTKTQEYES